MKRLLHRGRDLKPENILIDEKGYIKLADLGMCKRVAKQTTTMCGTLQYMAPEIISVKAYGQSVDWWALGVIVYEMMSGNTPFNAANDKRLIYNILNCEYNIPVSFSPDLSDLVKNLLQNNLTKRYGNLSGGVDDIKRHRYGDRGSLVTIFHVRKNRKPTAPSIFFVNVRVEQKKNETAFL